MNVLNETELKSATWMKLKGYLEKRMVTLSRQNEGDLNEISTAKIRGRISEIRLLLAVEREHEMRVNHPRAEYD